MNVETKEEGRLRMRGETFYITTEAGQVFLAHPRWSLMGSGSSLYEAELDLIDEARALADALVDADPATLDRNATAMRRFALGFLTVHTTFAKP